MLAAFQPESTRCSLTMLRQLFETFLETTETEKQDDGTVDDAHAHLEYSTQASVGLWALQLPELKIAAASRLS